MPQYGCLFAPINEFAAEIKKEDLVASPHHIANWLNSLNIPALPNAIPEKILEQPSASGLAIIADYYNQKHDQHCNIYVASTMEDFQNIVLQINAGTDGDKAIVIFQPVSMREEWKEKFYIMHKMMVYLEKKNAALHMLVEDSVPFQGPEQVCLLLADEVLGKSPRVFYTQEPALDPDKKPLYVQTDNWSCGTHAFRLARVVAKDPDFLSKLQIISGLDQPVGSQHLRYTLPIAFAKCIDSKIGRDKFGLLFKDAFAPLTPHYAKYPIDHSHIKKFTRKYLWLIDAALIENSQQDLKTRIANSNAKNFKVEPHAILQPRRP
jgi:hypothetical protein